MKTKDFLAEFEEKHFPQRVGPWIELFFHDPPFTRTELGQMARQNIIEWDRQNERYRLTLKASEALAKEQTK